MRNLICIFLLLQLTSFAQDKVYLKNGKRLDGVVVSVASELIYFKKTDTSAIQKLRKEDVLLIDGARGSRYIFGADKNPKETPHSEPLNHKRNSLGMQPLGIFTGRITFGYERLSKNGRIGVMIPLILTFDPTGSVLELDSTATDERIPGMKVITGLDINFYITQEENSRLFIGPRIRYGTDMLMGNIEGVTIQTQVGYRFGQPDKVFSQHLSVGFGILRIITPPAGSTVPDNQFYGWFSVNYRLGFNW